MKMFARRTLACLLAAVMLAGIIPAAAATESGELLSFAGANMTLGNELVLNFMVNASDIDDPESCTAEVTNNGGTVERSLSKYNEKYYYVPYALAAAQMADEVSVCLYDAAGEAVSEVYTRSIKSYAHTMLSGTAAENPELVTLMVDMLNYGTEAQKYFAYNEENYAGSDLTEEEQAKGTAYVEPYENRLVRGENYLGSNLSLVDRILLNVYFSNVTDLTGMRAEVEYEDARGHHRLEEAELSAHGKSGCKVTVDELVQADARQDVTVRVYNADGSLFGEAVDSVESYIARNIGGSNVGLYDAIMRFAASAYAYVTEEEEPGKAEVFIKKFDNGNFTYRIGNGNAVTLGSLFEAAEAVTGPVSVTVENETGSASGTYTPGDTWQSGSIRFSGIGRVTVTAADSVSAPTELTLEVVDAVNTTGAASATSNSVVLLQDAGFSSLTVSGGHTLYGNGFTLTCAKDSVALDMGYAFVDLKSGTLDNVQIVCPNFDHAVLYKSNMTETTNRREDTDRTRYYNVRSGVMVSGSSRILNSRICGARAAVNVSGGDLLIENSRIELGAVASVLVGSANSLTMRDVTLVQKPTASTYDSTKELMGFSVLYLCDSEGRAAPTTLEGRLIQNAWVDETDAKYVPSGGTDIIEAVLGKTDYLHDLDGDGQGESLNLGFAYMPEDVLESVAEPANITDGRTDAAEIPYEMTPISVKMLQQDMTFYVFSYKNTNGTDGSFREEAAYVPDRYGDVVTVTYTDTAEGLTAGRSYGADGWVYELNADLDKLGGYAVDFEKVVMTVNGAPVTDYLVNGSAGPTAPVAVTAGGVTYRLTAAVDGKEHTALFRVTGTQTDRESPSLAAADYGAGVCVATSHGSTWSGAAPALEGIRIRYWSVAEQQYKTVDLADCTPAETGQLNGSNNTWTYSPDNGDFTLTLTGGQVHSSNNVSAMPVVVNWDGANRLFFVAASSKGLVNSGNSARAVPVSYSFRDNNGGDVLTFSHTWSVAEDQENEYGYTDFCSGVQTRLEPGSGDGCVTPETLITLADGRQVRVDSLTGEEELLVWNMQTGCLDTAPILFVDSEGEAEYEIIHLYFSDGTEVKVVYEHGFWDHDLNRYVYLDAGAADYIGHTFAKQNGEELAKVTLTDAVIEREVTTAWSPVTAGHLCYFVNGMLSMPGGVGGLFNIFDVVPGTMTYDLEAMEKDIGTYGLFTYEELNAIEPLSEDMFNAAGGAYLKISIGKGNLTVEELRAMIRRYSVYFD